MRGAVPAQMAYVPSGWLSVVAAVAGTWTVVGEDLLTGPAVSNGSARARHW
jgi:hypothetical protein